MNETKHPLLETLGESSNIKVISFFLAHPSYDYGKTELANYTGLSRQSIYKVISPLIHYSIIKETRKIGRTTLYQLNHQSKVVKALNQANEELVKIIISEQQNYEPHEVYIKDVLATIRNE